MNPPRRGEIWLADLDPTKGREQAGKRPVLIVSEDLFNAGPAELVVVLPVTTRSRGIPSHVPIHPPEGGVRSSSVILCEAIRSVSLTRLQTRWGAVTSRTMRAVDDVLRVLLRL